jgi:hypothetical protein
METIWIVAVLLSGVISYWRGLVVGRRDGAHRVLVNQRIKAVERGTTDHLSRLSR